jgi:hypothetical protein
MSRARRQFRAVFLGLALARSLIRCELEPRTTASRPSNYLQSE